MNIVSAWTRQVESGQQPTSADLHDHLAAVHDNNPGFTEACAWNCRDAARKNSYQLLADIVDPENHSSVLDLACGSGVLLDLCRQRFGNKLALSGIDMSDGELKLARDRLGCTDIELHQGMAQDLNFIADSSLDVILCHWALTLMDPLAPVFATVKRVLRENGILAAIIDGDAETAPGYREIHDIIYGCVRREYPNYGIFELGDPRVRKTATLKKTITETFRDADIEITPLCFTLDAAPDVLAREVVGFFYASFVLSETGHRQMLMDLERHFGGRLKDGVSYFTLPANRLVVRQKQRAMQKH